ncbi:14699_t:CDS:2, partial [Gigaspora margarita]
VKINMNYQERKKVNPELKTISQETNCENCGNPVKETKWVCRDCAARNQTEEQVSEKEAQRRIKLAKAHLAEISNSQTLGKEIEEAEKENTLEAFRELENKLARELFGHLEKYKENIKEFLNSDSDISKSETLQKLADEAIAEDTMNGYYNLLKSFRKNIEELEKLKGNEDNANDFLARMTGVVHDRNPKIRLIRNQGKIAKTKLKHETENARTKLRQETENARLKLRQKWEMEHLEIENQTILEEMAYETEKLRWESGLAENTKPEMPSIPGGQNNSDLLSGLKQQGTNFFQSQVDKVKQTAEDKEDRIKNLEKEIQALKAELDLHWEADLKKQQEIQALQDKQHKEIIQKQEDGFFKQKMIWLGSFTGLAIAAI